MKNKNLVLALVILLSGNFIFAQKVEVNTTNSSIEWVGKKKDSQHNGNIMLKSGSFILNENVIESGTFVMDMTSITNLDLNNKMFNSKLVKHLKAEDFFDVEKFPTATFNVTRSNQFKNGKATVTGEITIKGVTETISFDVEKTEGTYTAKIEIDRTKFGIKYGSSKFSDKLGAKAIQDIFTLDIELALN